MYLSELQNIFVQIAKCICPNCKMYLSKLLNVFVQINRLKQLCPLRCRALYWRHRCLSCILAASSNWNIRFFHQTRFLQKQKLISPRSCLRYFPISYRAVNGCCTGGGLLEIHLWIFGKYLRSSYYSVPERNLRYFFGSQKITSLKDGKTCVIK